MKAFVNTTALLAFFLLVNAKKVVYDWTLTYKNVNPDGLHERRVIGINDQWPPLPIKLNMNDTLVLHIHNKLSEPTTIHAHGILQNNGTNLYDGAAMVTQCPIPYNYNFTYEFPVTQAGTFWIHSHFKVQYMDGLRVPLIVYNPSEPFDYDHDEIITVSDWYHENSYTNLEQYMNKENLDGVEPVPQSGLINDHINASLVFKPDKTYRLRLINMSGIAVFGISLDGHEMDVIEIDGVLTKKTHVRSVYIAAGQRISVLVKTKNSTDFNYRLRADMAPVMFDSIPDDLNMNIEIPIYYDHGAPFAPPEDPESKKGDYNDGGVEPFHKLPPLQKVDQQINMTLDFMENTDGLNHGVINGIPYLPPYVPSLHTALSIGPQYVNNIKVYGSQTNTYLFELNQVIEVVINNLDDGPHPFHLHGHVFQVIERGQGVFHKNQSISRMPKYPTIRDTIGVPSNGYAVLRFKADNPGVWFIHCHVDWHVPAGLAATFITAPELIRENLTSTFTDLCDHVGLPATGNAAGKEGLDLEGAPDGIRPKQNGAYIMGALVATFVGVSTILWHVWVDPGTKEENEDIKEPLLSQD